MREGQWEPTHTIKDEPVMLVKQQGRPPYYVTEDGHRKGPSRKHPPINIPAAHQPERSAPAEDEFPDRPMSDADVLNLAQETGEEIAMEPFFITLDELGVCADACRNGHRAEAGSSIAIHRGDRLVTLSRRDEGVDRRYLVQLPPTYEVAALEVG